MTIVSANINSSLISIVRYNVEELTLDVLFTNGRCYRYSDVAFDDFIGIQDSESAGVFYNDNICNVYTYEEIDYIGTSVVPVNTHVFQSSFLRTAQFDGNTNHCTVTLRNGRQYTYELNRAIFNEFISSQSAGRYFNDFISRLATRVA